MTLALLMVAALLLAYANGANDNFKASATLYGSGTYDYRASLGLATVAQIAGSVASVVLAGALIKAFSGKGLVPPEVVKDPNFLVAVGLGAAATVLIATRAGLPISTTHALVGGLVGGGLALAPGAIGWGTLGSTYFLPLLVSPVLATFTAAALYPPLRAIRKRLGIEATTCLCVGETKEAIEMGSDGAMVFRRTGIELTVAEQAACTRGYAGEIAGLSAEKIADAFHSFSALSLGFARGLNDTPKVLALLVASGWAGLDARISLAIIAVAMMIGGLLHSRRIADTLGHRITGMNRGQGLLANAVGSSLVIGASLLGSPVSTTHVSTGAIFGIGVWTGSADWRVAGGIVLAWVATLPMGALLAYLTATALGAW